MNAAVLRELGAAPALDQFDDPVAGEGQLVVDVAAAGVNHVDLARASGTFYTGPPPLPSVVGTDGVGRLSDGRRVYFDEAVAPFGSMAERTLVAEGSLMDVADGVDDAVAAALGNSGLAGWLALTWGAELQPGETVLVLGATGAVGSVALQVARLLGATRVIAADRGPDRLRRARELGADEVVDLAVEDDLVERLRAAAPAGVDVTIDPLWGTPALAAMQVAAHHGRLIQIGQVAGLTCALPAPVLRSARLSIIGHANFHAPLDVRRDAYRRMTEHAARGELAVELERLPLDRVGEAWRRQSEGTDRKLVLIP
jgi:NADPH:quinone reductase-like Zn-dependent oxidoreductase